MNYNKLIQSNKFIYYFTFFASLLISLVLFLKHTPIGNDPILYIHTAEEFLDKGLKAAFKSYHWAFHSIIAAYFHKITSLSIENSIYLLNSIYQALVCLYFVKFYRLIAKDGRVWVAALLILTFIFFNENRQHMARDSGFWAFSLIALYYFNCFYKTSKLRFSFLWQIFIIIATIFRPEAVVYAILLPFIFLFNKGKRGRFFLCYSIFILGLIIVISYMLAIGIEFNENLIPQQLSYINLNSVVKNFIKHSEALKNTLIKYNKSNAQLMLFAGLISVFIWKILHSVNIFYLLIFSFAKKNKWKILTSENKIVFFTVVLSFIILSGFILNKQFLASRYMMFMIILIALLMVRYLDYFLENITKNNKLFLIVTAIFFVYTTADAFISSRTPKTYLFKSGNTIKALAKKGNTLCNNKKIRYYSGNNCQLNLELLFYGKKEISKITKNRFRYLVIWVKKEQKEYLSNYKKNRQLKLIEVIPYVKSDAVYIFEIR